MKASRSRAFYNTKFETINKAHSERHRVIPKLYGINSISWPARTFLYTLREASRGSESARWLTSTVRLRDVHARIVHNRTPIQLGNWFSPGRASSCTRSRVFPLVYRTRGPQHPMQSHGHAWRCFNHPRIFRFLLGSRLLIYYRSNYRIRLSLLALPCRIVVHFYGPSVFSKWNSFFNACIGEEILASFKSYCHNIVINIKKYKEVEK